MELRRFGDSLLQSRKSPLLSFLVLSTFTPSLRTTASLHPFYAALASISSSRKSPAACLTQRYASSSAPADTTASNPSDADIAQRNQSSDSDPYTPAIHKILNDTLYGRLSPNESLERTSEHIDPSQIGKTSSDSVKNAYNSQIYGKPRPKPGTLASTMEKPTSIPTSSSKISKEVAKEYIYSQEPGTRASLTVRSRPSVGRTIEINPERGVDLGRGLRSLEITCAQNNVRIDAARQVFHERGGLKRKRLKSERWRKRFKIGFNHVVGKVKVMRRKGW